ncbi:MAG: C1q-like domain-containing protein [Gammaproteobacteria bacterium]
MAVLQFQYINPTTGAALSGVSCTIKDSDGNTATVYSDEALTSSTSQPLTTDSNGRIEVYVPPGIYEAELGSGPDLQAFINCPPSVDLEIVVTLSADQTGIVTATDTKVAFDTETDNVGNTLTHYDETTNYRFTAPWAGRYTFDVILDWVGLADGDLVYCKLYKNGAEALGAADRATAAAAHRQHESFTIWLDAADYVEVYARQESGGNEDLESDNCGLRINYSR